MKTYKIKIDSLTEKFYTSIAQNAGLPVEQVLSDSLFRFAGELSAQVLLDRGDTRFTS